jgi:hypothetical protein
VRVVVDPGENRHVSVITEDEIRSLAMIRSERGSITTCYLDVDGRRHVRPADYERELDSLLRKLRGNGVPESASEDLARIEQYVKSGFDRSRVRGIAVFAGGADDLWRVIELPVPVRSELVVNASPSVAQLEAVVQQATTIGVLAVDKIHARVFVFRLGELVEHTEITDDIGRDYDSTGEHDRGVLDPHRDALEQQHLRRAAALLWSAHQQHPFDHVTIAVHDHFAGEVERHLHQYLRERLHSRLPAEPNAPEAVLRDAVLELARTIEQEREAALVDDLRAAIASDGRGVAELLPVLDALAERRVERLLVSDGYAAPGWRCPSCNRLATVGRMCSCGAEMQHLDDVVEHAIEDALLQSCTVDVCIGNADLDVLGRIGALLRY